MKTLIIAVMISFLLKLIGCGVPDKKNTTPSDDELKRSIERFENRPVYKELTIDIIDNLTDKELEQAIFDNIQLHLQSDTQDQKQMLLSLTAAQRAVYVTWMVEAEVNNGGFNQFYFNTGELADLGEESFRLIGAPQFAQLMTQANLVYGDIKESLEQYDDGTVESFSKSYKDNPLNALDEKFYRLYDEEPLGQLKIKFIRENAEQFVSREGTSQKRS